MKRTVSLCLMLAVALFTTGVIAQDAVKEAPRKNAEEKAEKGKEGKKGKASNQLLRTTMKQLEKAELNEEQKGQIEALAKQWEGKISEASKAAQLSKEQREMMTEARKAAAEAGQKGKESREAVEAAAGLTDAQKAAMAKLNEIRKEFNMEVHKLLTEEQKAKIGKTQAKKGKKNKDQAKEASTEE